MPSMRKSPWAKLMTRITPKMRPAASACRKASMKPPRLMLPACPGDPRRRPLAPPQDASEALRFLPAGIAVLLVGSPGDDRRGGHGDRLVSCVDPRCGAFRLSSGWTRNAVAAARTDGVA